MEELLLDPEEKPCDTNTQYQSVVIKGTIEIIENLDEKKTVLSAIVKNIRRI